MLDGLSCSGSSETRTATSENACLFAQLAERCSRQLPRGQLALRPGRPSLATGSRLPRSYRRRRCARSVVVDHDSEPQDDVVRRPRLDPVAVKVCGSAISTSKPGLCRRIGRAIDCPYISGEFAASTLKINAFLSAQTRLRWGTHAEVAYPIGYLHLIILHQRDHAPGSSRDCARKMALNDRADVSKGTFCSGRSRTVLGEQCFGGSCRFASRRMSRAPYLSGLLRVGWRLLSLRRRCVEHVGHRV